MKIEIRNWKLDQVSNIHYPISMKLFWILGFVICLFSVQAHSQLTANIEPSRTTCTAPCAVFFEGTESTDDLG